MAAIGAIVVDIRGNSTHLVKTMEKTNRYLKKQTASFNKYMSGMSVAVVGLAAAYGAAQIAAKAFSVAVDFTKTAAEFEKFSATLVAIEGSADAAKASLSFIEDFTKETPFQLAEVTENFIKLRSYGIDPTIQTLTTLGDTASAMGKSFNQVTEAVADAATGEFERLKELGIKGSKLNDEATFRWVNASNERRSITVANNEQIIQSTLESIWSSKFSGAMELQSKTWNGLLSNMMDNWTIFQKNIMDGGVFEYLKAIVIVAGEWLGKAFDEAGNGAKDFATVAIDGIRYFIGAMGSTYDSLETFGDYFAVVGDAGKVAFYGLTTVFAYSAEYLVNAYEGAFNFVIDGINGILSAIETVSMGTLTFGRVAPVNWTGGYAAQSETSHKLLDQAKADLSKSWDDLMTTGSGKEFTDKILVDIEAEYQKLQAIDTTTKEKTDFGDIPGVEKIESVKEDLKDFVVEAGNVSDATEDVNDNFKYLNNTVTQSNDNFDYLNNSFEVINDTIYSGSGSTYDAVNNLDYGMSTLTGTFEEAEAVLDRFIFQWNDTFIGTIELTMSSLSSVFKDSTTSSMSYEESLNQAIIARDKLIKNPLDVAIGEQYKDAYENFLTSSTAFLADSSGFSSTSEKGYAAAVIASQKGEFEDTALKTYDVLSSMNDLLAEMNKAFADGILTPEEKAVIAGVAADVNAKNEVLLGSSGAIATVGLGTTSAVNAQEYFNNDGLATDLNMNAQEYFNNKDVIENSKALEYYNNSGLATDSNISLQEYYNNSGLATSANLSTQNDLLGGTPANSITAIMDNLYSATGDGTYDMNEMTKSIALATGLTNDNIVAFLNEAGTSVVDTPTIVPVVTPEPTAHWVVDTAEHTTTVQGSPYYGTKTEKYVSGMNSMGYDTYDYRTVTDYGNIIGYREEVVTVPATGHWAYYQQGGYTGNYGVDKAVGTVHGREYVLNAKTTSNLGLNDSSDTGVFGQMASRLGAIEKELQKLNKTSLNTRSLTAQQLRKGVA